MFRKVEAGESVHKELEKNLEVQLKEFERFAEMSSKQGKNSKSKSGKASSYRRYLCKMGVIYYEAFGIKINNLYSFETLKAYEALEMHPKFKLYNEDEGRFPSATLNSYRAFLAYLHTDKTEDEFVETTEEYTKPKVNFQYDSIPTEYKEQKVKEISYYNRSFKEKKKALENSDWLCVIDQAHLSFISKSTGKNYIELHHLIPLSIQGYFKHSIDFAANLVSLCPNCHRKIHFGEDVERKVMIKKLFEDRKQLFEEHDIKITYKQLLSFYNIKVGSK